jgi:hypothetical protein
MAEPIEDQLDDPAPLLGVRDIEFLVLHLNTLRLQLGGEFASTSVKDIRQDDRRALFRERTRVGRALSASPAGNQRDLAANAPHR